MKTLILDRDGATLTVRLHRPKERNALNADMLAELTHTFTNLDSAIRCVVLTGEGPIFCAGADIHWMKQSVKLSEAENARDAAELAKMFDAVNTSHAVVIGQVNGLALGGGVGLAACCDMVAAAPSASFGFTEVRLGLIPAVISPHVVRKMGFAAARHYFLTGEIFDAASAQRHGLVQHLASDVHEMLDVVRTWKEAVIRNGPGAVREAKKLLDTLPRLAADDVTAHVVKTVARIRTQPEAQEGFSAFLEKRPPAWVKRRE